MSEANHSNVNFPICSDLFKNSILFAVIAAEKYFIIVYLKLTNAWLVVCRHERIVRSNREIDSVCVCVLSLIHI